LLSNLIEFAGFALIALAFDTLLGHGAAEAAAGAELLIIGAALDGVRLRRKSGQ
jgi:hypothetical protein